MTTSYPPFPQVMPRQLTTLSRAKVARRHPGAPDCGATFRGGLHSGVSHRTSFRGDHEPVPPPACGRCRAVESGITHVCPRNGTARRLYSGKRAAIPTLHGGAASQIDLEKGMANLTLLTQLTADEAWDALEATEAALHHWVEALADGEVTPEEAATGIEKLETALKEAREAKAISDFTYRRNRASETLMRVADAADACADSFSWYRQGLLRDAGVEPVPDNVVPFRTRGNDDAA